MTKNLGTASHKLTETKTLPFAPLWEAFSLQISSLAMPSPAWSTRLESKLSSLNAASSRESFQAIAKWIAFNRKRCKTSFVEVFKRQVQTREIVVLGIIHEIMILDASSSIKWDRLQDLRNTLGEQVLLEVELTDQGKTRLLQELCKEWDESSSFGGSVLLNLIRKRFQHQNKISHAAATPVAEAPDVDADDQPSTIELSDADNIEEQPTVNVDQPMESTTKKPSSVPEAKNTTGGVVLSAAPAKDAKPPEISRTSDNQVNTLTIEENVLDFESMDIPAARVEPASFQDPCRAIATLQIARDLRNDGAVQLSCMLSDMPTDVRRACAEAAEQDNQYDLDETRARDFAARISQSLLDLDLEEQLSNVQAYRSIVDSQRQAREQLILLIVQSRCNFGALEAAEAFHAADKNKAELLRRKQILTDAMELEGFDVIMSEKESASKPKSSSVEHNEEFPPLPWYAPETSSTTE